MRLRYMKVIFNEKKNEAQRQAALLIVVASAPTLASRIIVGSFVSWLTPLYARWAPTFVVGSSMWFAGLASVWSLGPLCGYSALYIIDRPSILVANPWSLGPPHRRRVLRVVDGSSASSTGPPHRSTGPPHRRQSSASSTGPPHPR